MSKTNKDNKSKSNTPHGLIGKRGNRTGKFLPQSLKKPPMANLHLKIDQKIKDMWLRKAKDAGMGITKWIKQQCGVD